MEPTGTITGYEPTWRERASNALAGLIGRAGVNNWKANKLAQTVLGGERSNLPLGLGLSDLALMAAPGGNALMRAAGVPAGLLAYADASKQGNPFSAITVWHGSPHKMAPTPRNPLGEFDPTKIGTGEGAQAYSYGHYLGGDPATGHTYAAANRGRGAATDGMLDALSPGIQVDAMKVLNLKDGPIRDAMFDDLIKRSPKDAALLQSIKAEKTGYLYKVDLPDEAIARMLDWDAPLSQQAPEVQAALKSMVGDVTGGGFDLSRAPRNIKSAFDHDIMRSAEAALSAKYGVTKTTNGWVDKSGRAIPQDAVDRMLSKLGGKGYENAGQLYNDLASVVGSQSDISATLRNNGIPGTKYFDGASRGAGQGTRNYVVFPGGEDLLTILERNGVTK